MKSIAGYNIVKLLAKGGMAAIYLAEQASLQRQVVLKFLNPKLDDSIRKRFIDEGRIIASLEHPNIITVFDVVSTQKYNFLAMEFLEGGDLEQQLKTGLGTYAALQIISKISDALHLIHKQGIIHGDIKPANVLFRKNGCPLITDFGISHQCEPKKEVDSGMGDLYASPTYASPELIQGKPFDYRTDMYSLGIMMYEMLVGEKPFLGETEMEVIANSIQDPIPELPDSLKEFQPLMESLLAKKPEYRLSDTKLVTRFVDQYLKDHPELKELSSETKLIDSDVIVEYISKRKHKKEKNSSNYFLSPLLLILIFSVIIWLNKETLWNQWFSDVATSKPDPANTLKKGSSNTKIDPEFNTDISDSGTINDTEEVVLLLKQSEQDLLRHQELLSKKEEEIEQVKLQLEKQKIRPAQNQYRKDKQIVSLLRSAQQGLKDYRLSTPLNDNALYYFQKVLEMDPENKKAKKGIEDVVYRYEILARSALDKYNYQKAQQFISTGLSIDADNKRLKELQEKANIQNEPERALKKVQNFLKNL